MSLDVEKDFLSNVDYLKSLVKEIKSKPISDFDSNLVYEVTYADMYVTDVLSRVRNKNIADNINDIKLALDLVISNIPKDDVVNARKKSDYTKILKAKYKNIDDGSFEEEVAYENIEESSILKEYLKKRAPSIVTIVFLMFIQLFGFKDLLGLVNKLIDLFAGFLGIESGTQATSAEAEAVMLMMQNCISSFFALVVMLMLVTLVVTLTVDIMYISLPFLRDMFDSGKHESKWVSIYAKSAIEDVNGQLIKYKKIKSFDRIKRNQYWLQSMIDTLTSLQQSGKKIDINFAKSLVDLQSDIKTCTERSREWYNLIAKIEFMHDRYINSMKGYENEE